MSKNVTLAVVCNFLIVALEVVAMVLGKIDFLSHAHIGNILLLVSSLLVAVFTLIKKQVYEVPVIVMFTKYVALITVLLASFVTLVVQIPVSYGLSNFVEGFKELMLNGYNWILMLAAPAVAKISFIFFEGDRRLNKKKTMYYPLVFTVAYLVLATVLSLNGTYVSSINYLLIANLSIVILVIAAIVFIVVNYLFARWVLYFNQKYAPRIKLKR